MPADTYVYGVMRKPPSRIRCSGVAGTRVYTLEHRGLSALVSDVPERVRAKRRDLMSHSDVLQTAFGHGTVIPFRFGTVFPDKTRVAHELLADRHDELHRLIDDLEGLSEVRLRAQYDEDAVLGEIAREPAVKALRGRAGAEVALGEAVAKALVGKRNRETEAALAGLVPLSHDVVVDSPQSAYELLRASFLVANRDLRRFDRAVEKVAKSHRGTAVFTCVGPLPPHSFVRFEGR